MRSVTPSIIAATTQAAGKIGITGGAATVEGVKQIGEDGHAVQPEVMSAIDVA